MRPASAHPTSMLFKKRINLEHYCRSSLEALFEPEREKDLEDLRQACNDPVLNAVEPRLYFNHFRAVVIQIMLDALKKKCSPDLYLSATTHFDSYLTSHGLADLSPQGAIGKIYSSDELGIILVVVRFSGQLTGHKLRSETANRFRLEFDAVLKSCLRDFKYLKLTTKP